MMGTGILHVVFNRWIRNQETNEMPYKIGITKYSVHDRYYGLGLKMPGNFEALFAYQFEDCSKAEQLIHGMLNKYRKNGEWFNINRKQLDYIKNFHRLDSMSSSSMPSGPRKNEKQTLGFGEIGPRIFGQPAASISSVACLSESTANPSENPA
jgi:hypothetical protein